MNASKRDIHVQRDSFTALCGRRIGTPRGRIYPGVQVERPEWFAMHPYPDAMRERVCRACLARGSDALRAAVWIDTPAPRICLSCGHAEAYGGTAGGCPCTADDRKRAAQALARIAFPEGVKP